MCVICVQFDMDKLTRNEVVRALAELINTGEIDEEHAKEVLEKIDK